MRPQLVLAWSAPQRRDGGAHENAMERERSGNGANRSSTVLVVEDEVLIRLAVCDYLRDCGYRVLEASGGEEAQAVFTAGESVEILFSDIHLAGGMDGFTLASWVRTLHPDVRIILTSGVARAARQAGALCAESAFLQKPYSFETLVDHIGHLLGGSSRQRG